MKHDEAISAIHRLVSAEVTVMKQMNRTAGPTKKAMAEESSAAATLFHYLTGDEPTKEQIECMVGM